MKYLMAAMLIAGLATGRLVAQVSPDKAESTFTVHNPDLEWKLWASEPLFANPTSIDIDHRGRVWVCESVNYRHTLRKQPPNRPAGDRILILEDSKATGKADEVTVFYQAPELLAPLGIAVAKDPVGPGWKVYVCQSPDILVFEDKDGDGHADGPPKKLLTGFEGVDHDHGVHGISIGPDGKLYFSVGDRGVKDLQSSDGKGRKWTTNHTDCQAGTIWRCDMDGTNLELIAHNFRNEYEPCVDSFGNIWTSDNDDDGNEQTRICYVMPGGNYGYWPRGKGESHWHEEQPGVVPKVLRTGFGSPTGMCVYEGTLLPQQYQGQLLHTDAGPRHVRCYHTKPKGAGYEIEREDIVTSTDNWFRPSDLCVAPDGSVFVADWYDPGVGGHGMGDTTRGRIYRLATKGFGSYKVPAVNLNTSSGLLAALASPCIATRAIALQGLRTIPTTQVISTLAEGLRSEGKVARARALQHFPAAMRKLKDSDEIASAAETLTSFMRSNREGSGEFETLSTRIVTRLAGQPFPADLCYRTEVFDASLPYFPIALLREQLVGLRLDPDAEHVKPYALSYARVYDGHDRFYLAALGIAVGTDPKRREVILADFDKHFPEWNDKVADLVWELRPPSVLPRLDKLLADGKLPAHQRARIVDILATGTDAGNGALLLRTLASEPRPEIRDRILANLKLFLPTKWKDLAKGRELAEAIDRLLEKPETAVLGLALIAAAERTTFIPRIRQLLATRPALAVQVEAVRTLGALPSKDAVAVLRELLPQAEPAALGREIMQALGQQVEGRKNNPGQAPAFEALQGAVAATEMALAMREGAVAALAGSRVGTEWLLDQHAKHKLPPDVVPVTGRLLRNSPFQASRNKAMIAFPPPARLDMAKLPTLAALAARRGDPGRGKQVLDASLKGDAQCVKCHAVQGAGGNVGPDLSTIGTKASRENLFESILYPSKAVADQFVQWNVTTTRGVTVSGLLVEEKPDHLLIRDANGKDFRIERKDVGEKEKNPKSLMPEDIAKTLTEEELVDLVEYLVTLQSRPVK